MDGHDPVDPEAVGFDILHQVGHERETTLDGLSFGWGGVYVGERQNPLDRKVDHQHRFRVRASPDRIQLDCPDAVADRVLLGDGLDPQRARFLIEGIGSGCVRARGDVFDEPPIALVGDDGQAGRDRRSDATRVVEVMVCIDDFGQRLVWVELPCLFDHGESPHVPLWGFDQRQVVVELDDDAVMGAPGQVPDAPCHLLDLDRGHPDRSGSGLDSNRGLQLARVRVDRRVHFEDRCREAIQSSRQACREHDLVDLFVVLEHRLNEHVAQVAVVG